MSNHDDVDPSSQEGDPAGAEPDVGPALRPAPSGDDNPLDNTLQNPTQTPIVFQIACVDRLEPQDAASAGFTQAVRNEIVVVLTTHLTEVSNAMPAKKKFTPAPSWNVTAANLKPFDVVVYFVLNSMKTRATKAHAATSQTQDTAAGFTTPSPTGVVCEVYVENNFPAKKLANIAFHELMHSKLDVGTTVLSDMHISGGGGLAKSPVTEQSALTATNKRLLVANLFTSVQMWTRDM